MNNPNYIFKGFDLTKWEGGLPVWACHADSISGPYKAWLVSNFRDKFGRKESDIWRYGVNQEHIMRHHIDEARGIELRFTDLKDIIDQAPSDAEYFQNCIGQGRWLTKHPLHFMEPNENKWPKYMPIEGHLFDKDKYPKPVNLAEFRKAL